MLSWGRNGSVHFQFSIRPPEDLNFKAFEDLKAPRAEAPDDSATQRDGSASVGWPEVLVPLQVARNLAKERLFKKAL